MFGTACKLECVSCNIGSVRKGPGAGAGAEAGDADGELDAGAGSLPSFDFFLHIAIKSDVLCSSFTTAAGAASGIVAGGDSSGASLHVKGTSTKSCVTKTRTLSHPPHFLLSQNPDQGHRNRSVLLENFLLVIQFFSAQHTG